MQFSKLDWQVETQRSFGPWSLQLCFPQRFQVGWDKIHPVNPGPVSWKATTAVPRAQTSGTCIHPSMKAGNVQNSERIRFAPGLGRMNCPTEKEVFFISSQPGKGFPHHCKYLISGTLSWAAVLVCVQGFGEAKCPCPLSQPTEAASHFRTFTPGISKLVKLSFKTCTSQPTPPFSARLGLPDTDWIHLFGSCFTICLLSIQKHFVYCKFKSRANNDALFPCWSPKMINWALHKAAHWGRNVLDEVVLRGAFVGVK